MVNQILWDKTTEIIGVSRLPSIYQISTIRQYEHFRHLSKFVEKDTYSGQRTVTKIVTNLTLPKKSGGGIWIDHLKTNWNDWIKKESWWRWRVSNPRPSQWFQSFANFGGRIGVNQSSKKGIGLLDKRLFLGFCSLTLLPLHLDQGWHLDARAGILCTDGVEVYLWGGLFCRESLIISGNGAWMNGQLTSRRWVNSPLTGAVFR